MKLTNELKVLLNNVRDHIKKLPNENALIKFLDNYKQEKMLIQIELFMKDQVNVDIIKGKNLLDFR